MAALDLGLSPNEEDRIFVKHLATTLIAKIALSDSGALGDTFRTMASKEREPEDRAALEYIAAICDLYKED